MSEIDYKEIMLKLRYCDLCKDYRPVNCGHVMSPQSVIITSDNPEYEKLVKLFEKNRLKIIQSKQQDR